MIVVPSANDHAKFEEPSGPVPKSEKLETNGDVACLHVGPVPEGSLRNRFLAVG